MCSTCEIEYPLATVYSISRIIHLPSPITCADSVALPRHHSVVASSSEIFSCFICLVQFASIQLEIRGVWLALPRYLIFWSRREIFETIVDLGAAFVEEIWFKFASYSDEFFSFNLWFSFCGFLLKIKVVKTTKYTCNKLWSTNSGRGDKQ